MANLSKFTQKSMEALDGAETLAVREKNAELQQVHLLAAIYALLAFGIGALIYKKKNHKFLYYV